MKITINYVNPPIPIRTFDWSAITDSYDGDGGSPCGWGKTELEALEDLVRQLKIIEEEKA